MRGAGGRRRSRDRVALKMEGLMLLFGAGCAQLVNLLIVIVMVLMKLAVLVLVLVLWHLRLNLRKATSSS